METQNNTYPYLKGKKCGCSKSMDDLEHLKVIELKKMLKKYHLSQTGKKAVLCKRLRDYLNSITTPTDTSIDALSKMKVTDLQILAKKYDVPTTGKKADLVSRLSTYLETGSLPSKKQMKKYQDLEEILGDYQISEITCPTGSRSTGSFGQYY